MVPAPVSAKLTLSYPLYAVDFDHWHAERLVVGGGGGGGRSGVSNKLTVLDATNATRLSEVAEIDLSKDEDSVMSLAVGPTKGNETLIYAGVNSGESDQAEGKNKHFRIFGLEVAAVTTNKAASARILELSRTKLFTGSEPEAYQRVTRLSRPFPNNPQVGVAATGAGLNSKQPEIVLFDTAASITGPPSIRGQLKLSTEAKDADVMQTGKDEYTFAYCTAYEIFVKKISSKPEKASPTCIYVIPGSQDAEKPSVPTFRCIRFLSAEFLVLLTNIWGRNGVVVQIMRLPPTLEGQGRCGIVESVRLPSNIKTATGLAVCNLSPPSSPGELQGNGQFMIAVASTDISISIFTCNYQRQNSVQIIADLKLFQTLKEVHPLQITGIAFSGFETPKEGTQPKELKLASVSMGNTVVVHSFKLSTYLQDGKLQYVARPPSASASPLALIMLVLFTIFTAFVMQVTLEIRGVSPSFTGIKEGHLQPDVVGLMKTPIFDRFLGPPRPVVTSYTKDDKSAAMFAASLLSLKAESAAQDLAATPVIIIRDESHPTSPDLKAAIKADLHDESVDGPHGGKYWEELSRPEKEKWIKKLKDAGHWAEDFGDTVFKGVLFGTIGGAIGAAIEG